MTISQSQSATLALWYVVNASLSAYHKLVAHFGSAKLALSATGSDWQALGIHAAHITRLADEASVQAFLRDVAQAVATHQYQLLFLDDAAYPKLLGELYDPPPVLFFRGNVARLNDPQIAMVGSRNPSDYAQKITHDIAQYLVQCGYTITSGLAQGVDAQAHRGALAQYQPAFFGRTVGVMGTGIDVCYPKQHQSLFDDIVAMGGCLVSELLPKTLAGKHTFPRRNRLVAGLSLATIVTEAALQSGSLITARLTNEQGKQVFVTPNRIDYPNAEGCHHLIREGATLIYHPMQVVDDIKNQSAPIPSFTQFKAAPAADSQSSTPKTDKSKKQAPLAPLTAELPAHLTVVYAALSHELQDLDALIAKTALPTAEILAQLIELELMGLVNQIGGRYAKQ